MRGGKRRRRRYRQGKTDTRTAALAKIRQFITTGAAKASTRGGRERPQPLPEARVGAVKPPTYFTYCTVVDSGRPEVSARGPGRVAGPPWFVLYVQPSSSMLVDSAASTAGIPDALHCLCAFTWSASDVTSPASRNVRHLAPLPLHPKVACRVSVCALAWHPKLLLAPPSLLRPLPPLPARQAGLLACLVREGSPRRRPRCT